MTPYEIELLLRFHCRANPLEGVPTSPILSEKLREFERLELIAWVPDPAGGVSESLKAGPALPCYVEAIMNIQAPVKTWYCSPFPTLGALSDG